jgi:hypothetical protein
MRTLSSGFCVDPIEKKPLNHFLPASSVLSFGTAGCNPRRPQRWQCVPPPGSWTIERDCYELGDFRLTDNGRCSGCGAQTVLVAVREPGGCCPQRVWTPDPAAVSLQTGGFKGRPEGAVLAVVDPEPSRRRDGGRRPCLRCGSTSRVCCQLPGRSFARRHRMSTVAPGRGVDPRHEDSKSRLATHADSERRNGATISASLEPGPRVTQSRSRAAAA